MKKILTLVVLLFTLVAAGQAQKLDYNLTRLVPRPDSQEKGLRRAAATTLSPAELKQMQKEMNITLSDDGTLLRISVIVYLYPDAADPTAQLQKLGIRVVNRLGRLLILDVPADKLYELEKVETIQRVEADLAMQPDNDLTRQATHVNALNGESPALFTATGLPLASTMPTDLTSPTDLDYYTGKGVLAGVLDQGFDFQHAAFRDATGTSRMKAVYVPANVVGQQGSDIVTFTGDDILNLTTDYTGGSHATHVAGIMSGTPISIAVNGETIDLRGMAPDADLLVGGLPGYYSSHVISVLQKIQQYAQQHNQPAVVNLSFGHIGGYYDCKET